MNLILFGAALGSLSVASAAGLSALTGQRASRPANPTPVMIADGVASLGALAWFVSGFFFFPWWVPVSVAGVSNIFIGPVIAKKYPVGSVFLFMLIGGAASMATLALR